jgi:hypothetical protein
MPRSWVLGLLVLAGCSTHPLCDVKDYFYPGKVSPNKVQPYGGVCIPQGPITGPASSLPPAPSMPSVPAIAVPVVPPPAPLPPSTGAIPPAPPQSPSIFPGR